MLLNKSCQVQNNVEFEKRTKEAKTNFRTECRVVMHNLRSFGPEKIHSMHPTEALYFCHQCRELH